MAGRVRFRGLFLFFDTILVKLAFCCCSLEIPRCYRLLSPPQRRPTNHDVVHARVVSVRQNVRSSDGITANLSGHVLVGCCRRAAFVKDRVQSTRGRHYRDDHDGWWWRRRHSKVVDLHNSRNVESPARGRDSVRCFHTSTERVPPGSTRSFHSPTATLHPHKCSAWRKIRRRRYSYHLRHHSHRHAHRQGL